MVVWCGVCNVMGSGVLCLGRVGSSSKNSSSITSRSAPSSSNMEEGPVVDLAVQYTGEV